jgi:hypothetical protein
LVSLVTHWPNPFANLRVWMLQATRSEVVRRGRDQLLAETATGAQGSGSNQHKVRSLPETVPTLADLGISKKPIITLAEDGEDAAILT